MRNEIFISYSHTDKKYLELLRRILAPVIRSKKVSAWDDTQIKPGEVWREEIKKALASAKIAILLVSPSFLACDFIAENELLPLLEAAKKDGLAIYWIPIYPSLYEETEIGKYQAAIDPSKPLANMRKSADVDRAIVEVIREILSNIRELKDE